MTTPSALLARAANDPYAPAGTEMSLSFQRGAEYLQCISEGREDDAQKILYRLETPDLIRLLRICKRAIVLIGGP